ncbi:MAG TPA: SRPBCC domain-containing protein [Pseudolysinimonas sp.]|nr:SRPBCC domain-containing protein [Pseudolysinimonas sp.]
MTLHDTLALERRFDAAPGDVFRLFAEESRWRRWFRMPGAGAQYEHDFRVGGVDRASSEFTMPDGRIERLENRATYLAIDVDRRVSYAYVAIVDEIPRWASLVTAELIGDGAATVMTWTEQVALLTASEGEQDVAHLRGSIALRFNAMSLALRSV